MSSTCITLIEPGGRIQLPADWADALGLRGQVALDRTGAGILIRPLNQPSNWDEVFADKLPIGSSALPGDDAENVEVHSDDLLF